MEEMQYLLYRRFSEIPAEDTEWLWFPYLPRGKIVLFSAAPGIGKTFFSLYLCAVLSSGSRFFGEPESVIRQPETVIYQTAEDGVADTLKKRLESIRPIPDYRNIINYDETNYSLSLSVPEAIEEILKTSRPALMIFDPLQAYLGADVDMHRANEIRPVMARIGALAEKYHCTMLFIMHNSKMQQSEAIYSVLGSVDIPAVSRSMLSLCRNPENENELILYHVKSSLAGFGQSIIFHLDKGNIVFDGYSDLTAEELYHKTRKKRKPDVLNDAIQLLQEALDKNGGYVNTREINASAKEHQISLSTFYSAKRALALDSVAVGYPDKQGFWLSPEIDKEAFKKQLGSATEPLRPVL